MCEIIAAKRLEGHLALGFGIYDFTGTPDNLQSFLDLDAHIFLSGHLCDPAEAADPARSLCALVPEDRLLLASNSPCVSC